MSGADTYGNGPIKPARKNAFKPEVGYATAAPGYLMRGYEPVPVNGKVLLVGGATGHNGVVDFRRVQEWCKDHATANTAVRALPTYIAIDIDHDYFGKTGADSIRKAEETLGVLPDSHSSTARGADSESRQRFYKVPEGMTFATKPFKDVEIVQRHHRYSVVAPSVHPETGGLYAWYGPNGEALEEPPTPDEFTELPAAWLTFLESSTQATAYHGEAYSDQELEEALSKLDRTDPDPELVTELSVFDLTSYDDTRDALWRLAYHIVAHPRTSGLGTLVDAVYAQHIASAVMRGRGADERRADLNRSLSGALGKKRETYELLDITPAQQAWVESKSAAPVEVPTWTPKPVNEYLGPRSKVLLWQLAADICVGVASSSDHRLYVYENGVWKLDDNVLVRRAALTLKDHYAKAQDGTIRNIALSLGLPELPEVADTRYLNLLNGMYDTETNELQPHSPDFLSRVQLPFRYNPSATSPIYDWWLSRVVPEDAHVVMDELLAYLLMSGNPLQRAVLLQGVAHSGKSTWLRLAEAMLGQQNVSNVSFTQLTGNKFAAADLYGKLANLSGDNASNYLEDSSYFKMITGDDTLRAERKYGHGFNFKCTAVPVFSANEFWASRDTTEGYYRRWLVVPFPNKQEKDARFKEADLHAEASGIFNRIIPRLSELLKRGEFSESLSTFQAKEEFKDAADNVRRWLQSDQVERVATASVTRTEAYRAYKSWCAPENENVKAVGRNTFIERVRHYGIEGARYDGYDYFTGITVKPPRTQEVEWA